MRNKRAVLPGIAGFGMLLILAAGRPADARRPVSMEKSLLGIRILQGYQAVLQKYGPPHRVYRATELVDMVDALDAVGMPTGGVRALGVAAAPAGGFGGGPMAGGPSIASAAAAGGPRGKFGSSDMAGGPSVTGAASAGGSGPVVGTGGGGSGSAEGTFEDSGGFVWAYNYRDKELAYLFSFNKDGRIEAVVEKGRRFGLPTSRGIGLGAPIRSLYEAYGWPDSIEQQGTQLVLRYNEKYHVQFHVLKNRVVGIAIFLRENSRLQFMSPGGDNSGGGMGPALASGGPSGRRGSRTDNSPAGSSAKASAD